MKRISLQKALAKIILSLAILSGPEALAQNPVTFSVPQNTMYYEHDGTNWVHMTNIINTYNAAGSKILEVTKDAVTNQNKTKVEGNYDSHERDTTSISYIWQNNAWVITRGTKTLYQYNPAGKITQLIFRNLQNGVWVNSTKTENIYNSNGKIIEEIIYQKDGNIGWSSTNKKRSIFTYVNGELTEKLTFSFSSGNWIPSLRRTYSGWHTSTIPMTILDELPGSNGSWNNWIRSTFTIGPNGSYIQVNENFTNGTWTPYWRDTYEFNTYKHLTKGIDESYKNGIWTELTNVDYLYTYSPQSDLLEIIAQYPDSTGAPKRNQWKKVYSNFQYFTRALGTSENQKTELALNVYPNPATDKVQIQLSENKPQALTVAVKDVTGKTWQTKTFKPGEAKQLNLEALPKGIYLLQLQTEAGSTVKRIVKQ